MKRIRPEKKAIVSELKENLAGSDYMLLVGYSGLSVESISDLRSKLREASSKMTVVNNSFLRKASEQIEEIPDIAPLLAGPTAMVTGKGDVAQVSKSLFDFSKENDSLLLKGGVLGSKLLTSEDVVAMSKLPSREVMLGMVVGTIAAPLSGLVGVMRQKVSSLLYVLKAVEEKKNTAN